MSEPLPPAASRGVLTTSEVAKRLGVSLRTVQLWVEAGILPAARTPGGHRRIPATAVEALALSTGLAERAASIERAAQAKAPEATQRRFSVLLVEDNAELRTLWEHSLAGLDPRLEIRVADTGYAALLHIGQQRPDLLVTDLRLPGMDGFEMIRALERDPAFAGIPTLAITSMDVAVVGDQGHLPQTVEILHKPVLPALLQDRVRFHLTHAGAAQPPA
ncbi:MAG: response regulator [Aquabacterium sp.]|nr:MAG: response regulator [Aquabacterium sp.]